MYFVLSVQVVVVDDLSNAVEESLNRVRELTKCDDDQLVFRKVRSPPPGGAAVFPSCRVIKLRRQGRRCTCPTSLKIECVLYRCW